MYQDEEMQIAAQKAFELVLNARVQCKKGE
jgi:hypothetical protein